MKSGVHRGLTGIYSLRSMRLREAANASSDLHTLLRAGRGGTPNPQPATVRREGGMD